MGDARLFQWHDLLRLCERVAPSFSDRETESCGSIVQFFSFIRLSGNDAEHFRKRHIEWNRFGGESGATAVLHAYDAGNVAAELYNSNQASGGRDSFAGNKFITPMIANGKVFVGTPTGVIVFGELP